MNKKTDLRIIKTKNNLYQTLIKLMSDRPFEEIKVSDICEKALVNRSTFYSHYSDKYELLSSYIDTLKESLEKELEKNTSIKNTKEYYLEMISLFLNHVEEKKEIYIAIGKTNKNGILMDMIYDTFKKEIIEGIDKSDTKVKIPSNFVATFYLGAVFSVGTEWLISDFKYTKEEMLNYLNILIPDELEIANRNDKEPNKKATNNRKFID